MDISPSSNHVYTIGGDILYTCLVDSRVLSIQWLVNETLTENLSRSNNLETNLQIQGERSLGSLRIYDPTQEFNNTVITCVVSFSESEQARRSSSLIAQGTVYS